MDNAPPTTHRITEFHKWKTENRLDMAPPFQRKPVWGLGNKSYLIDTVIKGLPIPEIYLQIKTDREGNTRYVVVDGQQRVRAILDYVDGSYAIQEEDNREYAGKYFNELPDGIIHDMWDYPLVVRELKTSKEDEVIEIFKRLNKNVVPLNRQELRHATYRSSFLQLVDKLADEDYWAENKIVSPNDVRRMLDAEFISEILIAMIHGIETKSQDSIDQWFKLHEEDFTQEEEVRKRFNQTRDRIENLFEDLRPTRYHYKAEFYALFVALADLAMTYQIPPDRFPQMRQALLELSNRVDKAVRVRKGEKANFDDDTNKFTESIQIHVTDKTARTIRTNVIRKILIPFLIAKDSRRDFNEEEKRIIWDLSPDKKCGICKQVVKSWDDYQPDHKKPHNIGGLTEIANGQVAHKRCNLSKSGKP